MSWEILRARKSNTCKYIYLPLNISSTWNSWTGSFTWEFYELCTRIDEFLLCLYFTSSQSHSGDHSPSKLLQQLEIKWHWRRQACEAQSIPPTGGPGKKVFFSCSFSSHLAVFQPPSPACLAVVVNMGSLGADSPLLLIKHTYLAFTSHLWHWCGCLLFLLGNSSCIFPAGTNYAGSFL